MVNNMIPQFLRLIPVHVLNEAAVKSVKMTKDSIARYAAMKDKNNRPMYQFLQAGSTAVVSKGQDVDFYDANGDKQYGIVQSVDAKSGMVSVKQKGGEVVSVQGYPKAVIG